MSFLVFCSAIPMLGQVSSLSLPSLTFTPEELLEKGGINYQVKMVGIQRIKTNVECSLVNGRGESVIIKLSEFVAQCKVLKSGDGVVKKDSELKLRFFAPAKGEINADTVFLINAEVGEVYEAFLKPNGQVFETILSGSLFESQALIAVPPPLRNMSGMVANVESASQRAKAFLSRYISKNSSIKLTDVGGNYMPWAAPQPSYEVFLRIDGAIDPAVEALLGAFGVTLSPLNSPVITVLVGINGDILRIYTQ